MDNTSKRLNIRWMLVVYDLLCFLIVAFLLLVAYNGDSNIQLNMKTATFQVIVSGVCVFVLRFVFNIYRQIWRYGGIQTYIRLLICDACAFIAYYVLQIVLPIAHVTFSKALALSCMNLLAALAIRMIYRYIYKCCNTGTLGGRTIYSLMRFLGARDIKPVAAEHRRIKVAIVGAGRVGTGLAEELINNPSAAYLPCCFIDTSKEKIGRQIHGISVFSEAQADVALLKKLEIQEIIFAIPTATIEEKKKLYEFYKETGCKIKVYDYPTMQSAGGGKRHLREFDIEELLFRRPMAVIDENTSAYYRGKTILITGGGGSIGSELCRQIARMSPKKLVVLDVYENGAYDIQQELKINYGVSLNLCVEIVSVCNRVGLERVFEEHHPDIILHAAAHKHVPLMEKNCIEAVQNNVFGTLNVVEMAEKYKAERFIMVSTDKAVNPTNVMGATKRMCEMIVQAHSKSGSVTKFSATRFGNVLGSAGSVIPLFKRQIAAGGPVTITDKRIIRYFMTIPEASQLVLQSGNMAQNGELFVLDMGMPVKILDLAENMIKLSGFVPNKDIKIIETGLRPGEKLYEELLVKTEELNKTDNSMIFVERDMPLELSEIKEKLEILKKAINTDIDGEVRKAMKIVVPTFKSPEEVNDGVTATNITDKASVN